MRNAITVVAFLLIYGCATKRCDVFDAVDRNDASSVKQYLESGGDPNAADDAGQSLLYIAIGPHGGMDVLQLLLEHNSDPNKGMGNTHRS